MSRNRLNKRSLRTPKSARKVLQLLPRDAGRIAGGCVPGAGRAEVPAGLRHHFPSASEEGVEGGWPPLPDTTAKPAFSKISPSLKFCSLSTTHKLFAFHAPPGQRV